MVAFRSGSAEPTHELGSSSRYYWSSCSKDTCVYHHWPCLRRQFEPEIAGRFVRWGWTLLVPCLLPANWLRNDLKNRIDYVKTY